MQSPMAKMLSSAPFMRRKSKCRCQNEGRFRGSGRHTVHGDTAPIGLSIGEFGHKVLRDLAASVTLRYSRITTSEGIRREDIQRPKRQDHKAPP